MTAAIIDGKSLSQSIRDDIKTNCRSCRAGLNPPGLATILVGDDPASQTYVRNKHRACDDVGIRNIAMSSRRYKQEELDALIKLNDDPEVTGILLQLPLPNTLMRIALRSHKIDQRC